MTVLCPAIAAFKRDQVVYITAHNLETRIVAVLRVVPCLA